MITTATLTLLQDLISLDYANRMQYALAKFIGGPTIDCVNCGWQSGLQSEQLMDHVVWTERCLRCNNPCQAGFIQMSADRDGDWESWKGWRNGRVMFEKDFLVIRHIWAYSIRSQELPYSVTKPLFDQKRMIDTLIDGGMLITLREPIHKEQLLSLPARYERAFLWQLRFPGESRVWNMFRIGEYLEASQRVAVLMDELHSSEVSASHLGLGRDRKSVV